VSPDEEPPVSVRDDNVRDDSTSFEVERHTDDQPPRDDIIEPDDIDAAEVADELQGPGEGGLDVGAGAVDDPDPFHRDDEPPRAATSPDDLPESQGFDADVADRATEDAGAPTLGDEER
jgi:hypothetical protein